MANRWKTPSILVKRGISLRQLSRLTELDKGFLSRIFSGKQNPSMKAATRIAGVLDWSLDDFVAELVRLRELDAVEQTRRTQGTPDHE